MRELFKDRKHLGPCYSKDKLSGKDTVVKYDETLYALCGNYPQTY